MEKRQIIRYYRFKNKFIYITATIFLISLINALTTILVNILFFPIPVLLHALNIALTIVLIIGLFFANNLFKDYEKENKIYMYKHLFENDEKKTY